MKNKYQEMYQSLSDNQYQYGTDEQWDLFKELVDKATPMKPDIEGDGYSNGELVYDTWICPNCGKYYEIDYDNYNYCPNCGQAIKPIEWGCDENE